MAAAPPRDHLTEPYSPELVLVDPDLAQVAREHLPPVEDTLSRLEEAARARALRTLSSVAELGAEQDAPRARMLRIRFGTATLLCGCIMAAVALGITLSGNDVESPGPSGGVAPPQEARAPAIVQLPAEPAKPAKPAKPKAPTRKQASPPRGSRRPTDSPRRFAWAPVNDATGYRFELFRGAALVLRRESKAPYVVVPTTWEFQGESKALAPGKYRWYVWPIVGERRASTAVVQAVLRVEANR